MIFDKSRILPIGLATVILSAPAAVFAGTDSGVYVGGGLGYAVTNIDDSGDTFDESDTSLKIFGGYNFGLVPFLDLAVEASYVDFGNPSGLVDSNSVNVDMTGLNAFGLVGFDLGPVGLFAKTGLTRWDLDIGVDGSSKGYSGTDPTYGIGAKFQLGSFAVRAEYEYIDIDIVSGVSSDVSMISVSGVFTF